MAMGWGVGGGTEHHLEGNLYIYYPSGILYIPEIKISVKTQISFNIYPVQLYNCNSAIYVYIIYMAWGGTGHFVIYVDLRCDVSRIGVYCERSRARPLRRR